MDLWDVAKVMWRRRWVALPMLLLTIAGAAFTATLVPPTYSATGHVTFLPPTIRAEDTPGKARAQNPWVEDAVADAVVIYLARTDVKADYKRAGFSSTWTAQLGQGRLPVIEIEVIGKTAEQAQATLLKIIEAIDQEVAKLQQPYPVTEGEKISTETLDSGQNVETVRSAMKRALIAVVGVGLILMVAVSVGVDASLRRRTRARAVGAPRTDTKAPAWGIPATASPAAVNGAAHAPRSVFGTVGRSSPMAKADEPTAGVESPDESAVMVVVDYQDAPVESALATEDVSRPMPDDATIVLPLSNVGWRKDDRPAGTKKR